MKEEAGIALGSPLLVSSELEAKAFDLGLLFAIDLCLSINLPNQGWGSNPGPLACETSVLPPSYTSQNQFIKFERNCKI